jgi:hypothetical protein
MIGPANHAGKTHAGMRAGCAEYSIQAACGTLSRGAGSVLFSNQPCHCLRWGQCCCNGGHPALAGYYANDILKSKYGANLVFVKDAEGES